MKTPYRHTRIALAVAGVALALGAGHAFGAAFGLAEQSGSGLGNAFAGGAAVAEDAATVWANPAGMSRIPTMQAAAALHLITPSIKFSNDGSVAALNQPLGHLGGDAGTNNIVPNMYFTVPINNQFFFGLGVSAPFGLVTDYGEGWIGRYQGVTSDLKTVNVNPAIAWKINDAFTLGVGVNYQRIDAKLTQATNYSAALIQGATALANAGQIPAALIPQIAAATGGLDGKGTIEGDDSAWGWNIGVLWNINERSRFGAHYRSSIKYNVAGNVTFNQPALPTNLPPALAPVINTIAGLVNSSSTFANGGVGLDIELPDKANVSYFAMLNDRWDIMADAQWTGWSSIPRFTVVRNNGTVLQDQHWDYKDVWRFSVGTNYRLNDQWMVRGGLAYDQTPTNDTDRSVRLPDSDRVWLSIGTQYKMSKNLKLDAGFTYIIGDGTTVDQFPNPTAASVAQYGQVKGSYDASVTILSGQVTYSF